MPLELADDGRDRVGREGVPAAGVEPVDGLHEAEARDLDEVVVGLPRAHIAGGELSRERQKSLDQLIPGALIATDVPAVEQLIRRRKCAWNGGGCGRERHLCTPSSRTSPVLAHHAGVFQQLNGKFTYRSRRKREKGSTEKWQTNWRARRLRFCSPRASSRWSSPSP